MSALWCYYCNTILNELCPSYDDSAQAMQDYLDAKHPTLCADSDDENSNDSGSNVDIMLKRQTLTITGQKRNLIPLNHSNTTSTGLNGQG